MNPFELLSHDVQKILSILEEQDKTERAMNLDSSLRLRQIPRETGEFLYQFISIYAELYENFTGVEIGTSGGYSTLWQAHALSDIGHGLLISLDNDPRKYQLASKNIQSTSISKYVNLIQCDAKEYLRDLTDQEIHYVFLDAEKKDYQDYYQILTNCGCISDNMVLIADNVISHAEQLEDFLKTVQEDSNVLSIILTIGQGLSFIRWR
ncbi:MAG: O-methyltransferase [Candidatus Hodarchaeota archaeon]